MTESQIDTATEAPPPPKPQSKPLQPRLESCPLREILAFSTLTALVLELMSGVGIAFHYTPDPNYAHASLTALETDQKHGVSLRAMHWVGASAVVGLALLAALESFWSGAYKRPGRMGWVSGILVLLTIVAIGLTGELLPWNEQGVFATEVRTGLIGLAPEGEVLRQVVLGGTEIAAPTLSRFFVLHAIVLPGILIGLLVWHVRARGKAVGTRRISLLQAFAGIAVTGLVAYAAKEVGNAPLGLEYVAGDTGFAAQPEWHFRWLNTLLKIVPPDLEVWAAVFGPAILLGLTFLLPFLDFGKSRSFRRRLPIIVPGLLVLVSIVVLSFPEALGLVSAKASTVAEGETGEGESEDAAENEAEDAAKFDMPYSLEWNDIERRGYRMIRRHGCLECHEAEVHWPTPSGLTSGVFGVEKDDAPPLHDMDLSIEEIEEIIEDPGSTLGTEDMPPFDYVPLEDRRAMGYLLQRLTKDS